MGRIVGHYAPRLLLGIVATLVVLTLVPAAADLVPWPASLALLTGAVLLGVSLVAHNRRLCERCIAALPLDASMVASRYRVRFRVAHLFESRLFVLGYLIVLTGSALLSASPLGRYLWAAVEASLGYLLLVYVTHRRLQPWCPYCRNGGEEQRAPTTPSPVSTHI